MPHKHPVEAEAAVKQLWAQTLAQADNPELTVHRLPDATQADVEALFHTLDKSAASTSSARNLAVPAAPVTTRTVLDQPIHRGDTERTLRFPDTSSRPPSGPATTLPLDREQARTAEPLSGLSGADYFAFQQQLGQGGMGVVFKARQESLDRDVAVKTIRLDREFSHAEVASFLREALTTGSLSHPNIPPVHLFGRDELGRVFMVMKKVEGQPWRALLHPPRPDGRPAQPEQIEIDLPEHLEVFQKVCDAVAFAHARGVVHRDLKPENVMIGAFGAVFVMDWGLALRFDDEKGANLGTGRDKASTVAGTPAYMAPEMALGELERIGPWTDIYLLGAILHEMLTGRPPHGGSNIFEVLAHAACAKIDPIKHRRGLPREARELESIVRKCLAEDPQQRYPSVEELQADVRAFQAGQGNRSESQDLASDARRELETLARETADIRVTPPYYPRCAEVLAKAHQALALWGHNPRATRLRQEALAIYADLALRGQDWGLAESLLRDLRLSGSGGGSLSQPLEQRLRSERDSWRRRQIFFQRAYRFAAVMFFVSLGLCFYLYLQWSQDRLDLEVLSGRLEALQREQPESEAWVAAGTPIPENSTPPMSTVLPLPIDPPQPPPPRPTPETEEPVFAPRLGAPLRLPRALDGPVPDDAAHARPILGFRVGPQGTLLLWDDQGLAWSWKPAERTPQPLSGRAAGQPLQQAEWIDGQRVAIADAQGDVRAGDHPDRPWQILLRAGEALDALDAEGQGAQFRLAAAAGRRLWLCAGRETASAPETLAAPILDVALRTQGGLLLVTPRGVEYRTPGAQHLNFAFPVEMASAWLVGDRFLMIPAQRRYELNAGRLIPGERRIELTVKYAFRSGSIVHAAATSDGRRIGIALASGELLCVDGDAPRVYAQGKVYTTPARALALDPDGGVLYALTPDGSIDRFDLSKWKP
ncbi:MAG: serine/threonine protein kinase [Planctomycetes bacterium]|nr:serine/threonine protein kinase [Planctomycetota bacterium]